MIWDCYGLCEVIRAQHEIVFPKANLKNQCDSYVEEYDELVRSTEENQLPFYADCFIAACGVARFSFQVGYTLCLEQWLEIAIDRHQEFAEEVIKKMRINAKRHWKWVKGKYIRVQAEVQKCKKCGKEFEKKKHFQKFCSNKCRSSYNAKVFASTEEGKNVLHERYIARKIKECMEEENEKHKE